MIKCFIVNNLLLFALFTSCCLSFLLTRVIPSRKKQFERSIFLRHNNNNNNNSNNNSNHHLQKNQHYSYYCRYYDEENNIQTKLKSIPSAREVDPLLDDNNVKIEIPPTIIDEKRLLKIDNSTTTRTSHSIHLISLPPLNPEESPKLIKDLWKWKDVVLGDGRDYFIPRPRALKALGDILIGSQVVSNHNNNNHHHHHHDDVCWNAMVFPSSSNSIENGSNNKLTTGRMTMTHCIEECAILSNCARMDILLCVRTDTNMQIPNSIQLDDDGDSDDSNDSNDSNVSNDSNTMFQNNKDIEKLANQAAQLLVSNCLLNQLSLYQSTRNKKGTTATLWEGISSFLDLPGMVIDETSSTTATSNFDTNTNNNKNIHKNTTTTTTTTTAAATATAAAVPPKNNSNQKIFHINDIKNKCQHLSKLMSSKYQTTNEIINHFCLIASGLAKRDSRPDRTITFRPFSSRDAHIMLQIKRTVDIVSTYPRMKIILDTALNAGKSARDVNKVPILNKLKGYDCEGKYSTSAPPKLQKAAIDDVKELVIRPAVESCMMKLKAHDNSKRIASFKERIDQVVVHLQMNNNDYDNDDDDVNSNNRSRPRRPRRQVSHFVKQLTHETIMKLRDGEDVDLESVIQQIENEML